MSNLFDSANNYTFTENGALTYKSSNSKVLDLFSMGGAVRTAEESRIFDMIDKAWAENPTDTLATLLYLRDIRGGQGEKRIYREALKYVYGKVATVGNDYKTKSVETVMDALFEATIEVGSWKDITSTLEPEQYVFFVKKHMNDESTLMYKYLPSCGGSKDKQARKLAKLLGKTPKEYRKWLTANRKKLNLVESKMCANEWNTIEYGKVPSQATLNYRSAFYRHDGVRYNAYIEALSQNKDSKEVKINTATLYPYQIMSKLDLYNQESMNNKSLQVMWDNLKDYTNGQDALVIADTSGSMQGLPMDVSTSLAIYFAERNKGIFRNEYITFSDEPTFVQFKEGDSIAKKRFQMYHGDWGFTTNFVKVFQMILKTAEDNNLKPEDMPKVLYCISDMEFDSATHSHGSLDTIFNVVKGLFDNSNYEMPTVVFWNVNSRQSNVPVKKNEQGVILVSGCSPSIFEMVISGDLNPEKFMYEVIHRERYLNFASEVVKKINNI